MANTSITIKLTPAEFDTLKDALAYARTERYTKLNELSSVATRRIQRDRLVPLDALIKSL